MQIQIVITLDQETGAIHVSGPLQNKVLCGMLEGASDVVRDWKPGSDGPAPSPVIEERDLEFLRCIRESLIRLDALGDKTAPIALELTRRLYVKLGEVARATSRNTK